MKTLYDRMQLNVTLGHITMLKKEIQEDEKMLADKRDRLADLERKFVRLQNTKTVQL